jgi:hypothetical protein
MLALKLKCIKLDSFAFVTSMVINYFVVSSKVKISNS